MKEREMKVCRAINAEIAEAMTKKELNEFISKDVTELVRAHAKPIKTDRYGTPIEELIRVHFEYTPITSRYMKGKPITGTVIIEADELTMNTVSYKKD